VTPPGQRVWGGPLGSGLALLAGLRVLGGDLLELVLPSDCAGCGTSPVPGRQPALRDGFCFACSAWLDDLSPGPTRPDPCPDHLPPTAARGPYAGPLRTAILEYKERGRQQLSGVLGAFLAEAVQVAIGAVDRGEPVLLVPIPATRAACRRRAGDHVLRLARVAADQLNRSGRWTGVAQPLRALPRPDSAEMGAAQRAETALGALAISSGGTAGVRAVRRAVAAGAVVVLVDDIITTGVTLRSAALHLASAGVPTVAAATLAATERIAKLPLS
jgi:predicted amidophosphoribosyltransferase